MKDKPFYIGERVIINSAEQPGTILDIEVYPDGSSEVRVRPDNNYAVYVKNHETGEYGYVDSTEFDIVGSPTDIRHIDNESWFDKLLDRLV